MKKSMTKENAIAIIAKVRKAEKLTEEERSNYESITLQDWADLLNAKENVQDLADAAAKKETNQIKNEKCKGLLKMEVESMFNDFISNPFYMGKRLVLNKKTNAWTVADAKRQLSFYDLEHAYQLENSKETDATGNPIRNKAVSLAQNSNYDCLLRMFLDNIARAIADEIKTDAPILTDLQAQKKADFEMEGIGMAKLEEQLRKVCAAICPESVLPKMLKEDVRFIKNAATNVKYDAIQLFNEKAMMATIFLAIKTRKEGGKYNFRSKANCHRVKKEG